MFDGLGRVVALLRENERLTLILFSTALVMSGQGVMAPVLPLFASSFGVGAAAIGLTLSTFALARLILNVPLGVLRHLRRHNDSADRNIHYYHQPRQYRPCSRSGRQAVLVQ